MGLDVRFLPRNQPGDLLYPAGMLMVTSNIPQGADIPSAKGFQPAGIPPPTAAGKRIASI